MTANQRSHATLAAAATLLCISTTCTAFVGPTTTRRTSIITTTNCPLRLRTTETPVYDHVNRKHSSSLFVASREDTATITKPSATITADADSEELLRVAQDLTVSLQQQQDEDPSLITALTSTTSSSTERPVITTSEEAAIFLADAPVRDEGAYIAEEGIA